MIINKREIPLDNLTCNLTFPNSKAPLFPTFNQKSQYLVII